MICAKSEFGATQIRPELDAQGHSSQHLTFSCAVTSLRGPKGANAVSDDTLHIILDLTQDTTQTKITGVSFQNVLTGLRRKSQYRSVDEGYIKSYKFICIDIFSVLFILSAFKWTNYHEQRLSTKINISGFFSKVVRV